MEREMEHQIKKDDTTKKTVNNSLSFIVKGVFVFGVVALIICLINVIDSNDRNRSESGSSSNSMLKTRFEDDFPHETLFKIWYLKEKGFNIDSFLMSIFQIPEHYAPRLKLLSIKEVGTNIRNSQDIDEYAEVDYSTFLISTICSDLKASYKDFEMSLERDPAFLVQAKDNLKNHVENSAVLNECGADLIPELMFDSCSTLQKGLHELSEFLETIENAQTAQLLAGGCYNSQVRGAGTLLTFEDKNVVAYKSKDGKKHSGQHFIKNYFPFLSQRFWIEFIQISGVGSVLFTVYNIDSITAYWDSRNNKVYKIKLKKSIVIDESGLKTNEFNVRGRRAEDLYKKWRMYKSCLDRGVPFARID